ncbi:aldo/keto reductase family protein [Clostridium beijerinckii]|uniref:aldo/keto reductase family protein n=1 Tax=Clostridium beijerinckii TaxID=1520 RepID=UPI00098BE909|nr:aldo/keto reductase [Clostridium beijerinckii]NRT79999.1 alcohol dehydrogenase (NADP+) [Clostridium beijerinckii]OOM42931.1 putative oxidoreductase YtbE [Clostridium beijerinckii]
MNFTPIDPNKVPQRTLYTGAKMPGIGMGTFGSDRFSAEDIANAVKGAAKLGFRLFDGASVYGNEDLIGEVYKEILASGIKREELFITSKVWNDQHDNVIESCKKTLKDLQLDYLDCYFVHWPFPNFHAKGVSVDSRDPNAKPYIHEDFMKTWRQMEQLVEMGLVKHIGTSSVTIPKLKLILRDAKIKPAVNEMELHPCFQQPELYKFCKDNGIEVIGFCPIGSPTRPDRDKTDEDIADIEEPTVVKIAKAHNVHPAVICVKWGVQHGHTPIPFSIHENEYYSNLLSAIEDPLTDEEMKELEEADKNCRLIKGQVFLWEGAKSWEDLWDLDGTITTL